jgi:hypothetical protein
MMMQSGILVSISGRDGGSLSIRDTVYKHFMMTRWLFC